MFRILSSADATPKSETAGREEFEKLTELINAYPQSAELSVTFKRPYLEALMLQCGSPQIAIEKLSTSLKAHEKLKEMGAKMYSFGPLSRRPERTQLMFV